jgi:ectoine hydroxylase-related dioxygenase (phytanoyl-CoA dioxygenase family)
MASRTETFTDSTPVTDHGQEPPKCHNNRIQIPPEVKHDDAFIPFERLRDAHSTIWPARKECVIPDFNSDSSVQDVVEGLRKVGGVIVRGVLTPAQVSQIDADMRPHIEADIPWVAGNSFFPPSTRRAFGLCAKSPTAAEHVIGNQLYQAVCAEFLTTKSYPWYGDRNVLNISPPQVNNTICFSVRPGNSFDQPLHRDDDIHYADRPRVDVYPRTNSREYGIGFFVAGTKTTKANGATRFIPGSHLEATEQPPDESFAKYAELNPGDGFIMLASCYHGGSANTTKDEERLLFSCFMTRGWLRQEENQYLAVPPEVAKTLSVRVQKLIGYQISNV